MSTFDELDETFEVAPIEQEPTLEELHEMGLVPLTPEAEDDFEHSRTTIRTLIKSGTEAVDGAINIAKSTDAPRAYEVAGQLLKTMSEIAKDLVALQKTRSEMMQVNPKAAGAKIGTQNNNVFVGTTTELIKMLKDAKNGEIKPA